MVCYSGDGFLDWWSWIYVALWQVHCMFNSCKVVEFDLRSGTLQVFSDSKTGWNVSFKLCIVFICNGQCVKTGTSFHWSSGSAGVHTFSLEVPGQHSLKLALCLVYGLHMLFWRQQLLAKLIIYLVIWRWHIRQLIHKKHIQSLLSHLFLAIRTATLLLLQDIS